VEALFCPILHNCRKSVAFRGFQASPACSPDKSNMWVKVNMEHWWNNADTGGKPTYLEKTLSQCHFFTHHDSDTDWPGIKPGHRSERPAANRLSHGTALKTKFTWILFRNSGRTAQYTRCALVIKNMAKRRTMWTWNLVVGPVTGL